jgi:O-antigen/teichoic acid export membrane protein
METEQIQINNNFNKNVILLSSISIFTQSINILILPILSRIYRPEDFGIFATYGAVSSILAVYSSLRFEVPIIIEEKKFNAIQILLISVIILVIYTLFLTVFLILGSNILLNIFDAEIIYKYRFLLPISIFSLGIQTILIQWSVREKKFKNISFNQLSGTFFSNSSKIGFGLLNFGPFGLIIGSIFKNAFAYVFLGKDLFLNRRTLFSNITKNSLINQVKRYKQFVAYNGIARLFNILASNIPLLFIGSIYGSTTLGFIALTNSVLQLPMSIIGDSVSKVFISEASGYGKNNPEKIKDLIKKLQKKLMFIGGLPFIIILFLGPFLFSLVFGETWIIAGRYSQLVSLMVFLNFITTPISSVLKIFDKNKGYMFLFFIRLVLILFVFFIARFFSLNSYLTVGVYSLTVSVSYVMIYFFSLKVLNEAVRKKIILSKKNEY